MKMTSEFGNAIADNRMLSPLGHAVLTASEPLQIGQAAVGSFRAYLCACAARTGSG